MVKPEKFGVIWVLWDPELPLLFQLDTLEFMARAPDWHESPEEAVEDWFAEASAEDTEHLVWAMRAWHHLKTAPTLVREMCLKEVRELRRANDLEDKFPF